MDTGPVGVLGRLGKGGTSLQKMQGSGSGGMSMEQLKVLVSLDKERLCGRIEIATFRTIPRGFFLGGISIWGRIMKDILVSLFSCCILLFSLNFAIRLAFLKVFDGLVLCHMAVNRRFSLLDRELLWGSS